LQDLAASGARSHQAVPCDSIWCLPSTVFGDNIHLLAQPASDAALVRLSETPEQSLTAPSGVRSTAPVRYAERRRQGRTEASGVIRTPLAFPALHGLQTKDAQCARKDVRDLIRTARPLAPLF